MSTLISVTISPTNPFILITHTQTFIATAHFSDALDLVVTADPTTAWDLGANGILSNAVATISTSGGSKGTATANSISGYTSIRATYGGFTGVAILRVGLTNYTRTIEQFVDNSSAHNPIPKAITSNFSMFSGGVVFKNVTGSSGGSAIGWTLSSNHAGNITKVYTANEQQNIGYWVQLNSSKNATKTFSAGQKNLGIVSSISVDITDTQLPSGGNPVLVQIAGEGYVHTTDGTIATGSFLGPSSNGAVHAIPFDPAAPTPILGFALENFAQTYPNMVFMRIQICGE